MQSGINLRTGTEVMAEYNLDEPDDVSVKAARRKIPPGKSNDSDTEEEGGAVPVKELFERVPMVCWLVVLFILLYAYTNRAVIFPENDSRGRAKEPIVRVKPEGGRWEYRVKEFERLKTDDDYLSQIDKRLPVSIFIPEYELNKLGAEGWELVSAHLEMETAFYNFGKSEYHTGIKPNVRPKTVVAIFKRPLE